MVEGLVATVVQKPDIVAAVYVVVVCPAPDAVMPDVGVTEPQVPLVVHVTVSPATGACAVAPLVTVAVMVEVEPLLATSGFVPDVTAALSGTAVCVMVTDAVRPPSASVAVTWTRSGCAGGGVRRLQHSPSRRRSSPGWARSTRTRAACSASIPPGLRLRAPGHSRSAGRWRP